MNWASRAIGELRAGRSALITPHGHSMKGRVEDGATIKVRPLLDGEPRLAQAVLVKVKGRVLLHLVKARQGDRYLIGNNRGGINGWVGRQAIYGVAGEN